MGDINDFPGLNCPSLNSLHPGQRSWLIEHVELLVEDIVKEAQKEAQKRGGELRPTDISEATKLYAPGAPVREGEPSWWQRIASSISGVTLISGLLALAFGVIGAYLLHKNGGTSAPGYFDIAKVFAGAVAGSTGVSVASGLKR